jgi:predicted DNA binding CopG/RHH family protein
MAKRLDPQEKELLELFEQKKLKRSKNATKEMKMAREAASAHIKKDIRVNIKISQFDLERIKRIAVAEGLPYQALIASILHKYAREGTLEINQD